MKNLVLEKFSVITNILEDKGIAFAETEDGESVFIEPKLATGLVIADQVKLTVMVNVRHRSNTQWKALKVELLEHEVASPTAPSAPTAEELQDLILRHLEDEPDMFFSSRTILTALGLGIGHSDLRAEADKLYRDKLICRAKVTGPRYQKRTQFYLYSKNIEAFLYDPEEIYEEVE
jgi:hypothetical protein